MIFTLEEYKRGIELCVKNSNDLIEEAKIYKLLMKPRGYALFQLSIEEIGKACLIIEHIGKGHFEFQSEKEFNEKFTSHKDKNEISLIVDLFLIAVLTASGKDSALKEKILGFAKDDVVKWKSHLNLKKNQSLYVSLDNAKFVSPSENITKEMMDDISLKAEVRNRAFQELILMHLDEIQQPNQNASYSDADKNLLRSFVEMAKEVYDIPNHLLDVETYLTTKIG
ncbi:MAG: AbiV family abortive infection protein [Bacteroidetes bacterium]|nr:AbiV family abortive infection protein [Bacteroidota bacterium]